MEAAWDGCGCGRGGVKCAARGPPQMARSDCEMRRLARSHCRRALRIDGSVRLATRSGSQMSEARRAAQPSVRWLELSAAAPPPRCDSAGRSVPNRCKCVHPASHCPLPMRMQLRRLSVGQLQDGALVSARFDGGGRETRTSLALCCCAADWTAHACSHRTALLLAMHWIQGCCVAMELEVQRPARLNRLAWLG